jgi:hypothetical protein
MEPASDANPDKGIPPAWHWLECSRLECRSSSPKSRTAAEAQHRAANPPGPLPSSVPAFLPS